MSQVQPMPQGAALAANQAVIRGRILEIYKGQAAVYTDVVLPAVDQYTQPQNVRIVSSRLIGKIGEDITQRVSIKGYRRKYKDNATGETRYSCDIALSAIED